MNMITCRFEDGDKASLRHVVVDNLVIDNNKILLVKRASHMTNPNKYGLVGGYVNRDETLKEAVIREIKEETGYLVKIELFFRIKDSPHRAQEDRQNISFVFTTSVVKKVGVPDTESSEVTWFELDKLPKPEEFAFDHYEDVELYKKYLQKPFPLPVW
ncbi:MAG: NUDIX hydrolase [bacterium]|nr:NUDIX hydrolase [bacterium]